VVARFDIDGVLFELVPTNDSSHLSGTGNARLTLGVDDLYQAAAALTSQGVIVSAMHKVQNGVLASFNDPDGNEIILWQYTQSTPRS
jgi:predicted enzyme related to lactoylglutathione lyase